MSGVGRPTGVRGRVLLVAAVGYAGLAMSITLLFLGMRLVMDVGGSCGSGGPYEWAVPECPDAAVPATLLGIFGFLIFGAIAWGGGAAIGGVWSRTGSFAWFALFAVLGWNFVDYGLFHGPEASGADPVSVFLGVLFWIMAIGPFVGSLLLRPFGLALGGPRTAAEGLKPVPLAGPGQPAQGEGGPAPASMDAVPAEVPAGQLSPSKRMALAGIAATIDATIDQAGAATPDEPAPRSESGVPEAPGDEGFTEGTQALLDRLERLADMRDRGLLDADEFEAAKVAIVQELEARS